MDGWDGGDVEWNQEEKKKRMKVVERERQESKREGV